MVFGSQNPLMVTRALVAANIDPEKQGRIQVTYPFFAGASGQTPSSWARVCMPYASKEHGGWFVPEVGDEVLVVFESSNIDNPIVVGTLYGPKNGPPSSGLSGDFNEDGKNNLRFIKTKSGNCLSFDDSPGKESIQMKDKGGATVKLEKGKIAIGNQVGELFDLMVQLLDSISNNAPTFVSTAVGPGLLNPALVAKVIEVKTKLSQMKGSI